MLETLQTSLYEVSQYANSLVANQLTSISIVSIGVVWLAGLLTSLTPCTLSMLPIMVGYMGGYEAENRGQAIAQASWFALGLATTLAALGLVAGAVGRVYGQVGVGLPIIVSVLAILMGLNLARSVAPPHAELGQCGRDESGLSPRGEKLPAGLDLWAGGIALQYPSVGNLAGVDFHYRRSGFGGGAAAGLHRGLCVAAGDCGHLYRHD
jgi:cytochrome c-type biogenesis protein